MKTIRVAILFVFASVGSTLKAQWASDAYANHCMVDRAIRGYETEVLGDGRWFLSYDRPGPGEHSSPDTVTPWLQCYGQDGRPLWDSPMELSRYRTLTSGLVRQRLMVDAEGNAVVLVQDLRKATPDRAKNVYAAYRVSPEGEHLWPEDGVVLNGNALPDFCAALCGIQMDDGSFVFAWVEIQDEDNTDFIRMQRVSSQGELLWGDGKEVRTEGVMVSYPALMDAGNNEYLLAYTEGADLKIGKFDFDGNAIWAEPTLVFSGTLPNVPAYTYLDVCPLNGGALLAFHAGDGPTYPYCAYILPDGSHGFTEADAGLRLGFGENQATNVHLCFDEAGKAVYAVWQETYSQEARAYYGLVSQKINLQGELLWDPEGIRMAGFAAQAIEDFTVSPGPKNTMMVVYSEWDENEDFDKETLKAVLVSPEGEFVWDTDVVISSHPSKKSDIKTLPFRDGQWIVSWKDNRDFGDGIQNNVYAQNVLESGLLGQAASDETSPMGKSMQLSTCPNPVSVSCQVCLHLARDVSHLRLELLDLKGAKVATVYEGSGLAGESVLYWNRPSGLSAGLYVLRAMADGNPVYSKLVLQ